MHDFSYPPELLNETLSAPWGSPGRLLPLSDGALMWHTEAGSGVPLVLLHGWRGTSRFWRRNAPELAAAFRVVVPDLRGHGTSTKILSGHAIPQYARDLRELFTHLNLDRPVLAGWSMSGNIAMEYWRQFGSAGVRGIALVDASLAPFAPDEWNSFRLKAGADAHSENMRLLRNDPERSARAFAASMFGAVKATEEELDWMTDEMSKTPPWIATAIHADFVARNYERLLPDVDVPVAVFSGAFSSESLNMGRHFTQRVRYGSYYPYPHCGHMPFYEDAATFNRQLAEFCRGLS